MLFAQADAFSHVGWTDKEVLRSVLAAVGGTLAVLVPVAWGLVKLLNRNADRRAAKLDAENRRLQRELANREGDDPADLRGRLDAAAKTIAHQEVTESQLREESAAFLSAANALRAERDVLVDERNEARDRLAAEQRRIKRAVQRDGAIWTDKVLANAPDFRPLDERRMPIVSVLNLKGGVGKTTATANLGAALARRGWRVLLVDLDLQGSLTGLFLTDPRQVELYDAGRLTGHFLEAAFDGEFPNIHDYAVGDILPGHECRIVPTTDYMAYAETSLTVRWFLRDTNKDPRFLLRKELHLKRVSAAFDVVLLDCPPLINVSCVNALAASDYVLVPVLPNKPSTDRVTVLVERLKAFHNNLNPDLRVMGFFANRTKESTLTTDERNRLSALRDKCKDTWAAAPCFDAFVRQSTDVRRSEDDRRPLNPGDELYPAFVRLAEEFERALPSFCRPAARPAPAAKGVML